MAGAEGNSQNLCGGEGGGAGGPPVSPSKKEGAGCALCTPRGTLLGTGGRADSHRPRGLAAETFSSSELTTQSPRTAVSAHASCGARARPRGAPACRAGVSRATGEMTRMHADGESVEGPVMQTVVAQPRPSAQTQSSRRSRNFVPRRAGAGHQGDAIPWAPGGFGEVGPPWEQTLVPEGAAKPPSRVSGGWRGTRVCAEATSRGSRPSGDQARRAGEDARVRTRDQPSARQPGASCQ